MKVIVKEPGADPEVRQVENTLAALQEIVGGPIEIVRYSPGISIICNEEGKIRHLERNFSFPREWLRIVIVGKALIAGMGKSGNYKSLTNSQIKLIQDGFK